MGRFTLAAALAFGGGGVPIPFQKRVGERRPKTYANTAWDQSHPTRLNRA